jgi:hypothetical protein
MPSRARATISFVIPVVRSTYLALAIESVLRQTDGDWELLVVDDSGDPATQHTVGRYPDDRIRYERTPATLGREDPTATWMYGVERIHGTFFNVLGDDDFQAPNFCAEMKRTVQRHPECALYRSRLMFAGVDGGILDPCFAVPEYESWDEFFLARCLDRRWQSTVEHLVRVETFWAFGGFVPFPLGWCSDDATFLRLAAAAGVGGTNAARSFWRRHPDQLSIRGSAAAKLAATRQFIIWMDGFLERTPLVRAELNEVLMNAWRDNAKARLEVHEAELADAATRESPR